MNTGDFLLTFYNSKGTKDKNFSSSASSLTEGISQAKEVLKQNEFLHSFTIDRRVFNSLDQKEKF